MLLGDHKQLPPLVITMNLPDVQAKFVNQSLMERALKGMPHEWVHQLTEQYRMPSILCQLVSGLFYEHQLVTAASRAMMQQANPVLRWLVVDSTEESVGTSKVNLAEAAVILEWFYRQAPVAKSKGETIKCITFYKLQRDLVRGCLAEDPEMAAMVVSVDASQGSEADHILLSTVRNNAKGDLGFCSDNRRLCVALSRAKATLTIVGNPGCMSSGRWGDIGNAVKQERCPQIGTTTMEKVRSTFEGMRRTSKQPCRFFLAGRCTNTECPFAHDAEPDDDLIQAMREKAKPCAFFAMGNCTKGSSCTYSHDFDLGDPRVKTEINQIKSEREPCQFYAQGRCTKGSACNFSHDFKRGDPKVAEQIRQTAEPCKYFARGRCTSGKACTFSHDRSLIPVSGPPASKGKGGKGGKGTKGFTGYGKALGGGGWH